MRRDRGRGRTRSLVAGALALLVLRPCPVAVAGEHRERNDLLEAAARIPWPEVVVGGYAPLFLELRNRTKDVLPVSIRALTSASWTAADVERNIELQGGEVRSLELPVYVVSPSSRADYRVDVGVPGEDPIRLFGLGVHAPANDPLRSLVVFTPEPTSPGDLFPGVPDFIGAGVGVAYTTFADLPASFASLTGLRGVVVDVSRGLPEPDKRAALAAYARAGGVVALFGRAVDDLSTSWPALGAWAEDRLLAQETDDVRAYACGHGVLVTSPVGPDGAGAGDPLHVATQQTWVLDQLLEHRVEHLPRTVDFEVLLRPMVSGLTELPYGTIALLLCAFAFIMGPVTFFFVKKSGRPVLLLVLVPAIAIGSSAVLVVTSLLAQGFDVKRTSHSLTVLDQRGRTSTTYEARAFHVGLMPRAGLRPGDGTLCLPDYDTAFFRRRGWRNRGGDRRYQWSYRDDGLSLQGDFLPARRRVRHLFVSDRPERRRLSVSVDEQGSLVVENQLSVGLEMLVVCDGEGRLHRARAVAPDEKRRMEPVGSSDMFLHETLGGFAPLHAAGRYPRTVEGVGAVTFLEEPSLGIPPGSYAARLAGSTFLDDCGIEYSDEKSVHHLVGVLELPLESP